MPSRPELEHAKRPVRLTLPISVAYDLGKFEQALANLAHAIDRTHFSGRECSLYTREFIIDAASLQVRETVAEL
jgi:hypothetical protein